MRHFFRKSNVHTVLQGSLIITVFLWLIISLLLFKWILSFPFQLRFLFATQPQVLTNLHILAVDGAFSKHAAFYPVKPPTEHDLDGITHKMARRVARYLERAGYLVGDADSDYLDPDAARSRNERSAAAR